VRMPSGGGFYTSISHNVLHPPFENLWPSHSPCPHLQTTRSTHTPTPYATPTLPPSTPPHTPTPTHTPPPMQALAEVFARFLAMGLDAALDPVALLVSGQAPRAAPCLSVKRKLKNRELKVLIEFKVLIKSRCQEYQNHVVITT